MSFTSYIFVAGLAKADKKIFLFYKKEIQNPFSNFSDLTNSWTHSHAV